MARTVVVYHYYELDALHRANLEYFLRYGYNEDDDYIIVIAGGCTLDLPVAPNIRYQHIANTGFHFSGYAHAVNSAIVPENYAAFVFLNSSARGPFLPDYCRTPWSRVFTDMLDGDVRLAGATINILDPASAIGEAVGSVYSFREPCAHVQSMIFAMDRTALEYLIELKFFDRPIGPSELAVVVHHEILLSQLILQKGWNISCLLPEYRRLDYRQVTQDINPTSRWGDPCFAGGYFHRSLIPYETVFINTTRDVIDLDLLDRLGASQASRTGPLRSAYQASRFDSIVNEVPSAWKGHKSFALWLASRRSGAVIVDLGVDFGFSTYCFAASGANQVFGIDSFEGDEHAGFRNTQSAVETFIHRLRLKNITILKGYFQEVGNRWTRGIDILQIDGRHNYEDVSEDFRSWVRFLNPGGIVLLHDTCVGHFGVRRFFDEIDLPKTNFWNAFGLGLISKDAALIAEIAAAFEKLVEPGTTRIG